jgi:hypothetical protein
MTTLRLANAWMSGMNFACAIIAMGNGRFDIAIYAAAPAVCCALAAIYWGDESASQRQVVGAKSDWVRDWGANG